MNGSNRVAIPCCCPGAERLPAGREVDVARAFKALADPTRVAIVNRLGAHEVCVCDLTAEFELSQPTISHHLKVLREAGIVASRDEGNRAYYRLVPEAIGDLAAVLGARAA
jgi:ArsR family transcriptional regulator